MTTAKTLFNICLLAAVLATTGVTATAAAKPRSTTLRVESPSDLPALAQKNAEAMYLQDTGDGRSFLYVEGQGGRELTVLDVTGLAKIKRVAQTPIAAGSAFDFVQSVGADAALIRYRNGSGVALLSFKRWQHPTLAVASVLEGTDPETLGETGLLLKSRQITTNPISDPPTYKVVDTSNPSHPELLATIPAVTERLSKADTGTLFLLNKDGVTVVRRLRVEKDQQIMPFVP